MTTPNLPGRLSRLSRTLRAARPRIPRTVRGRRRLVQAAMALIVAGLLPFTWIWVSTGDRVSGVAQAPEAPVAIVFGAGVRPDGEPTQVLARRLDAAAELYHRGRVQALLVTGDNGTEAYNEPAAMRRYLLGLGVPGRHVVQDHAGFSTWDSCARASGVFGVTEALLVTQDFHVPRAVALCEAAGIDSWGVSVPEPVRGSVRGVLREFAAAGLALWDVAFTPPPQFPGPPETSLDRALRAP